MTEARPRALVLTGHGINCEEETAEAWRLAGAEPVIRHVNDLVDGAVGLDGFFSVSLPGGFSYGDHLGSGLALAQLLLHARPRGVSLRDELAAFAAAGGFVLGICNGFQVLVKSGLLPGLGGSHEAVVSLVHNDSGKFEDRWVRLVASPNGSPCARLERLFLPVRHGEGKLIGPEEVLARLFTEGHVLWCYADAEGHTTQRYPANPNGSFGAIAGLCDTSGRILGLMPHPEAFLRPHQHPWWTRLETLPSHGEGLALFSAVVAAYQP